jgi:NADH dehydrogenase
LVAEVSGVDVSRKEVIADGRRIPFDALVIATGARHAYFGHDEWSRHAPGLKRIDDATYLRRRILLAFEKAETETEEDERRRLLSFVIVGAGPTGVEMAGAIAELARKALAKNFRSIDPAKARIVLVEAGPRVLPSFDPPLATAAQLALERLGVEARLGGAVTACDELGVVVGGERIEARTIVWAAGVMASPAGKWLGAETDRSGRVIVGRDLIVPGHRDVFVLGDTASVKGPDDNPLPGIAPVAKAQGAYVAARIIAALEGRDSPPFRYRDRGSLVTIGRKSAVVGACG